LRTAVGLKMDEMQVPEVKEHARGVWGSNGIVTFFHHTWSCTETGFLFDHLITFATYCSTSQIILLFNAEETLSDRNISVHPV
jgi:hypothetical protein